MATAAPQAIDLVMNTFANASGQHVEEIIKSWMLRALHEGSALKRPDDLRGSLMRLRDSYSLAQEMDTRQLNEHLFQTGSFSLPVTPSSSLDETALGSESKFMSRDAILRQA